MQDIEQDIEQERADLAASRAALAGALSDFVTTLERASDYADRLVAEQIKMALQARRLIAFARGGAPVTDEELIAVAHAACGAARNVVPLRPGMTPRSNGQD